MAMLIKDSPHSKSRWIGRARCALAAGTLAGAVALLGCPEAAQAGCLPAPTPLSGPSTGTVYNPQPIFRWSAVDGATYGYTLYILLEDGTWVVRETAISGTSFRPRSPLPAGVSLRWKVKAEGECGAGNYASAGNFRIEGNPGPSCPSLAAKPVLIGPSGTISRTAPTFSWRPVAGAEEYVIVLLYASQDEACVLPPDPNGNCNRSAGEATSINLGELPTGVDLRWKVKWECPEGSGEYGYFSDTTYFRIEP